MPADMFTHSRDGRQPAPEGPFARTRPILVDGEGRLDPAVVEWGAWLAAG